MLVYKILIQNIKLLLILIIVKMFKQMFLFVIKNIT